MSEVLAVITEEEAQEFIDMNIRSEAINTTITALVDKQEKVIKAKHVLWEKIKENHGITEGDLALNLVTREIGKG